MGKPGRPPKKQKQNETDNAALNRKEEAPPKIEVPESGIVKEQVPLSSTVAVQDCWRYHPVQEPRIFRKGEIIPDGWTDDAAVRKLWACNPFGQFTKVKGK